MSESETSSSPATKPAAKPGGLRDKIKNSSKEELEVLASKLVDSLRVSKDQATKLQAEKVEFEKQLALKDADIQLLKKRESDLLLASTSTTFNVATPVIQDSATEEENGNMLEEHRQRLEEVERAREKAERERRRREEDLEASKALVDELRSQLEDARAEVCTLRDTKATVDIASLELADYAKKVTQLTKELKETKTALELSDKAKEELAEELARLRDESGKAAADSQRQKSNADELRKRAQEEKTRLAEMQLKVDEEKKRAETYHEDLTRERVALGRQLTSSQERAIKLEEIVEALREENTRLRDDRETADARMEEVRKEYETFKNRARYVLEQRTKENEEGEEREREGKIEEERRTRERDEMRKEIETAREGYRRAESDVERAREQLDRETTERIRARTDANEAQEALAKALDELRSLRVSTERAEEESTAARRDGEEKERRAIEGEKRAKAVAKELEECRDRWEEERSRLEGQLSEEKRRREEAVRQLEEKRERTASRPAAVAAVYPQFSESFHSERSHSPMADSVSVLHGHTHNVHGGTKSTFGGNGGHNNYSFDERCEMSPERLESVLFGEEACDEGRPIDEVVPIEDPVEEVMRLRQQLKWMQEMHTESETAAANMGEQMRVLKEEIRRLQRNSERTSHVEGNTEYLKNVIVKFISPEKVAGEKRALIPILHTMLRLSEEERNVLQTVADTVVSSDDTVSNAAGWGGMLTKWTGLS